MLKLERLKKQKQKKKNWKNYSKWEEFNTICMRKSNLTKCAVHRNRSVQCTYSVYSGYKLGITQFVKGKCFRSLSFIHSFIQSQFCSEWFVVENCFEWYFCLSLSLYLFLFMSLAEIYVPLDVCVFFDELFWWKRLLCKTKHRLLHLQLFHKTLYETMTGFSAFFRSKDQF